MARIKINFNTIFKRSSSLNSVVTESNEVDITKKKFKNLSTQLENIKDGQKISPSIITSLRSYMENLSNFKTVNEGEYYGPLYLMQEFNRLDPSVSKYILKEYTSSVLPYVENLSMMEESISRYDLTEEQCNSIIESANKNMIADRILQNHIKISKRFNMVGEVNKIHGRDLKFVVESCCKMIDTYTISPYAKFNLCLEEMGYVMEKEGIKFDKQDLVKYTTEYFLLRSDSMSDKDMKGFKFILDENCYIDDEDCTKVDYVKNPEALNSEKVCIDKEIKSFLIIQYKDISDLENCFYKCLKSDKTDIRYNIQKVIWLIWDVYKNNIFDNDELGIAISRWFNYLFDKIENESKDFIISINVSINKIKELILSKVENQYDDTIIAVKFKNYLTDLCNKLDSLSFITYNESNINYMIGNVKSSEPMPINEFKIFKFHNLVRAAANLDKFLKYKAKNVFNKGKNGGKKIIKRIKDVLFANESLECLYSSIGEDNMSDICVAQFYIDESIEYEVTKFLEETCKEFNNTLLIENYDTVGCYYIINPGIAEIHLKDSTPILIEDSMIEKVNNSYDESMDVYIESFAEVMTYFEAIEQFTESELNIESRILDPSNYEKLTLEEFEIALEALSLLNIDYEKISVFGEKYSDQRYNDLVLESVITEREYEKDNKRIKSLCENWTQEKDVPFGIQLEAFQILSAVLEAPEIKKPKVGPNIKKPKVGPDKVQNNIKDKVQSVKDKVIKKDNGDNKESADNKKNPFAGINLNSMKLYLAGLKEKVKEMSGKEKEVSRNLDNTFRLFVKSMKDALISDRREAIIKGSVVPSFSKAVKIAIGLAGVGLVTGNPLVPLLAAIGGFAASKKLTQKERILLLDEIDTELQVVEKEISMAESKNQMKRYRALLNYKKDLQRQYQRIRYNIRVGKDVMPGSTTGLKNFDN